MKYLSQRDTFRCGPIAIINVLKWSGNKTFRKRPVNEKLLKYLDKLMDVVPMYGTQIYDMSKTLREIKNIKAKRVRLHNIRQIDEHLKQGGIVLMDTYQAQDASGHYWIILDKYKRWTGMTYYKTLNFPENRKDYIVDVINEKTPYRYNQACWLITKIGD